MTLKTELATIQYKGKDVTYKHTFFLMEWRVLQQQKSTKKIKMQFRYNLQEYIYFFYDENLNKWRAIFKN